MLEKEDLTALPGPPLSQNSRTPRAAFASGVSPPRVVPSSGVLESLLQRSSIPFPPGLEDAGGLVVAPFLLPSIFESRFMIVISSKLGYTVG